MLAGAWSILLLVKNPTGERGLLDLLRGEIIAVPDLDLWLTRVTFGIVTLGLFVFQKEFLLVSFDRDMAVTLKKNVVFWDLFLFVLIGLTISIAVLSVGPMVTFGFLLIPPLDCSPVREQHAAVLAGGVGRGRGGGAGGILPGVPIGLSGWADGCGAVGCHLRCGVPGKEGVRAGGGRKGINGGRRAV